jgi:hypothetical protein
MDLDADIENSLDKFFKIKKNRDKAFTFIKRKKPFSIRIIEFYILTYSQIKNREYLLGSKIFNPHIEYRNTLKLYSKQNFDPFRRGEEVIEFKNSTETESSITTSAQLNFLKFVLKNKIDEDITVNLEDIKNELKKNKEQTQDNKKSKKLQPFKRISKIKINF